MNFATFFKKNQRIKLFYKILLPALTSLLFIPGVFLRLIGIRFLDIHYLNSIGHLALEPDCYIKEEFLGIHRHYITIILAPKYKVVNFHFLKYWRRYFIITTSHILYLILHPLSKQKVLQYNIEHYAMAVTKTASAFSIYTKWADRPPLLSLHESDFKNGWEILRGLGVPEGAWFVCVHARDQSYKPHDKRHPYRNVDISSLIMAMEALTERSGWCIRMGNKEQKPLPSMRNVIDYALLDISSDWMDVFLCASCRFFLGSNSGLNVLPSVFGVPCALTNLIPISTLPVKQIDIGIPKLLWSSDEERYVTFKEIMKSPLGNCFDGDIYTKNNVEIIDNTPKDIRDLALEMLALTEGKMKYTDEDEFLQGKFRSLFKPGDYGYGASSRIGRDFLRKYVHLL